MVHWSPFVMSFKKKYPWIQLAGHAGTTQKTMLEKGSEHHSSFYLWLPVKELCPHFMMTTRQEVSKNLPNGNTEGVRDL